MAATQIKRNTDVRGASYAAPEYEGYVDGRLVVFHRRRWVVEAVLAAIVAGHIQPEGDTVACLCQWAAQHSPELHARIVAQRIDGFH